MMASKKTFLFRLVVAFCIDVLVMLAPMVLIAMPLVSYRQAWFPVIFVALLWVPVYFLLRDGWQGAGVGKRLMGLCVVDAHTKRPISWGRQIERQPYFFEITVLLNPIIALVSKRPHQSPQDRRAGVMVVRKQDVRVA